MKLNTVWYCYTLLCIVIFHTVVASPYAARRIARSVEVVDAGSSAVDQPATLDDDVFGENSHHGGEKDKRLINPLKKIKPLKIGAGALKAGALGVGLKAASKIGKVGVKAAATLGIKALIINLLFGGSRGSNAGSAGRDNDSGDNSTTTELPPFDREKVALQIPNTFVGPAFNVVNGASQIIGNVLQVYHHPLNHHPLNHRPLNHHPLNHHPLNHHPLNHHPLNHHPSNHHPSNHHPLNHHPLNHHPLNHHPLNHHPLNHHPLNHHPLNHHPLNHHPLNHHPLNHHPLKNHKTPQDQWQGVNDSSLSISTHLKL
ncbi:uncharacterized protein [Bemisia tabaci]|uniref:uncharacterized protein isoform X3 n=1 Tax=Bemisia tabaci TaxID=7038 RepID=UPI003B280237